MFLYDLIAELCFKKGINMTTLCRECGIPRSTMTDYKKERIKSLSLNTLTKIADYFNVDLNFLCGNAQNSVNEEQLKTALFGDDITVTDEMWKEVKSYALYIKQKHLKQ